MTMESNYPLSRKTDLVIQELECEVLIYDLIKEKAFCLNESSAFIWQAADGRKSIAEISQLLSTKLKTPADENIVWLALDQLKKEHLLANNENIPETFNGMSRRQVIKKVGLASMIALPLIVSIVAPAATFAQSGVTCVPSTGTVGGTPCNASNNRPLTCTCSNNGNCASGTCAPNAACTGPNTTGMSCQ